MEQTLSFNSTTIYIGQDVMTEISSKTILSIKKNNFYI